jgi:hypothetical protein
MNWIERFLGITPDANTGATELAVGFMIAVCVAALVVWRGRARSNAGRAPRTPKHVD